MKNIIFATFIIVFQALFMPAIAQNDAKNEQSTQSTSISTEAAELAKIKQEKLAIETNSKAMQAACYKKFAVSDCLKDAKIETQAALNKVKRRELELSEAQRQAKAESDRNKLEKNVAKNANNQASDSKDKASTAKGVKTVKPGKTIKSDAEILAEKNAADQSRAQAAQKRLAETQQKQLASQKKAQMRVSKNSQASTNTDKYNQKLAKAQEHKQALEKAQLAKNKTKAAPLPVPALIPPLEKP